MSFNPLQCQTLIANSVQVSLTGTTVKTTLYSAVIKGGTMGLNDWLRFDGLWSYTNNANNKTLTININGSAIVSVNETTVLSYERMVYIINRNSLSSQVGTSSATQGQYGTIGVSTYSINTANDMTITWSGQLANAADTISFERGSVDIWRSATS